MYVLVRKGAGLLQKEVGWQPKSKPPCTPVWPPGTTINVTVRRPPKDAVPGNKTALWLSLKSSPDIITATKAEKRKECLVMFLTMINDLCAMV
ncbi:hypothetical protein ACOMHN_059646 [Nucella lapillus]